MSGERKFKLKIISRRSAQPDDPMFSEGYIVSPMRVIKYTEDGDLSKGSDSGKLKKRKHKLTR